MMGMKLVAIAAALTFCSAADACFALGPVTYNVPPDSPPAILNAGDILNVTSDVAFLGTNAAAGSQVNVLAGAGVAFGLNSFGSVHIRSGADGIGSWTLDGGTLQANGGANGPLTMRNGAYANIDGGLMAGGISSTNSTIDIRSGKLIGSFLLGSTLNVYGGDILSGEFYSGGSVVNVWGTTFTDAIGPKFPSIGELHFYVKNALVGGAPIPGLSPGGTATVTARNVVLAGELADGSAVNMTLYDSTGPGKKYVFGPQSILRVTLVPEPTTLALIVTIGLACIARQAGLPSRAKSS